MTHFYNQRALRTPPANEGLIERYDANLYLSFFIPLYATQSNYLF